MKKAIRIMLICIAGLAVIITGTILLVRWSLNGTNYRTFSEEKRQMMEQEFHIKVTDDLTLEEYFQIGFHEDRRLNLSTQKNLQAFLDENILSAAVITEAEQDSLYTQTKFEYASGNETVYGTFTELGEENAVSLFLPS
ncbi:MAG: hypothetical protein IKK51_06720 [Oscillospiraceae bacterium]|nr:hypothetical protein [Oscillospiraceae bacterium]